MKQDRTDPATTYTTRFFIPLRIGCSAAATRCSDFPAHRKVRMKMFVSQWNGGCRCLHSSRMFRDAVKLISLASEEI